MWNFGLRASNNRECGALEAADTLLGLPLFGTAPHTTFKFLDIRMNRSKRLKGKEILNEMNPDDENIFFRIGLMIIMLSQEEFESAKQQIENVVKRLEEEEADAAIGQFEIDDPNIIGFVEPIDETREMNKLVDQQNNISLDDQIAGLNVDQRRIFDDVSVALKDYVNQIQSFTNSDSHKTKLQNSQKYLEKVCFWRRRYRQIYSYQGDEVHEFDRSLRVLYITHTACNCKYVCVH